MDHKQNEPIHRLDELKNHRDRAQPNMLAQGNERDLGGTMELTLAVDGLDSGDEARSLYGWLIEDDAISGGVRFASDPPRRNELGAFGDTVIVALSQGGLATALASVLITWIRHRSSAVTVKIKRPDGTEFEIDSIRVRSLPASEIASVAERLAQSLTESPQPDSRDAENLGEQ
ncbi:hypothetical protein ACFVUS_25530 [Nocardia sp. NPDC058058]|uniref:effector-associated constant component EACC1 n=1 Tax=Nocardia sp. NPDC058058 TaxID=3346317 RepID=UPI0036DB9A34